MMQVPEHAIDGLRLTVPANPFRLDRVIVDVPDDPRCIVRELGAALMLKSGGGGGGAVGVAETSFDFGLSPAPFVAVT